MKENWPRALSFTLTWEGGAAIRSNEPGGAVNKGISLLAYKEWRAKHGHALPVLNDLLNISDEEVSSFYKERADQIGFDNLPSGYDLALFGVSTMQGIGGAHILHAKAKGDLGYLIILQMQKKMNDHNCDKYGPGWAARLVATYEVGRELASNAVHSDLASQSS